MAVDDILRIDGVEYERVGTKRLSKMARSTIIIRPKRKQTGWKCLGCRCGPCYCLNDESPLNHRYCLRCDSTQEYWQPFYGKVVE